MPEEEFSRDGNLDLIILIKILLDCLEFIPYLTLVLIHILLVLTPASRVEENETNLLHISNQSSYVRLTRLFHEPEVSPEPV